MSVVRNSGRHKAASRALFRKARKRRAEECLHAFVEQAWHVIEPASPFCDGKHIWAICEHLEALTRMEINRLCITVPPRHGKSIIVSVMWFCWSWIHEPWSRWLYSSYSSELSERDNRKCRELLRSKWYQERWGDLIQMKGDMNRVNRFENTMQGFRMATSVGGTATGEGGHYIVSDDPHKADESFSEANRAHAVEWWDTVMSSRFVDPDQVRRVVVMQRIHELDMVGHLMADKQRGYEILCLPAWYEENHPIQPKVNGLGWSDWRSEPGELLWPERFSQADMRDLANELGGPYNVAGQLQQRPAPDEGGVFDRRKFRYYAKHQNGDGDEAIVFKFRDVHRNERLIPAVDCYWFQTVDTALKEKDTSAWTVVMTLCLTPPPVCMLVVDVFRARIAVPEQFEAVVSQRDKHPLVQFQAVEEAASGIGLIQEAAMRGMPFQPLRAGGDKVTRCAAVSIQYHAGLVYHQQGAEWLETFENELLMFPMGAFADQVDTLAYGGIIMQARQRRQGRLGNLVAFHANVERKGKQGGESEGAVKAGNGKGKGNGRSASRGGESLWWQ